MSMKKRNMGFADKALFILGLTLSGVITFVLVVGVIIAVLKLYMDEKLNPAEVISSPALDDKPESALIAAPAEQDGGDSSAS